METVVSSQIDVMVDDSHDKVEEEALSLTSHADKVKGKLDVAFYTKTQDLNEGRVAAIDDHTGKGSPRRGWDRACVG
jgi:hypothetical protein